MSVHETKYSDNTRFYNKMSFVLYSELYTLNMRNLSLFYITTPVGFQDELLLIDVCVIVTDGFLMESDRFVIYRFVVVIDEFVLINDGLFGF